MARFGALFRTRRSASRLAYVPAVVVLAIALAPPITTGKLEPDPRMAAESAALLLVCLIQAARPTLIGWAIALVWFFLCTVDTIWLGIRPGFGFRLLPVSLVLVPFVFLLGFRPHADASERGAVSFAVLAGLVVVAPLFVV